MISSKETSWIWLDLQGEEVRCSKLFKGSKVKKKMEREGKMQEMIRMTRVLEIEPTDCIPGEWHESCGPRPKIPFSKWLGDNEDNMSSPRPLFRGAQQVQKVRLIILQWRGTLLSLARTNSGLCLVINEMVRIIKTKISSGEIWVEICSR